MKGNKLVNPIAKVQQITWCPACTARGKQKPPIHPNKRQCKFSVPSRLPVPAKSNNLPIIISKLFYRFRLEKTASRFIKGNWTVWSGCELSAEGKETAESRRHFKKRAGLNDSKFEQEQEQNVKSWNILIDFHKKRSIRLIFLLITSENKSIIGY